MTPAPGTTPGTQHRQGVVIAASGVLVLSVDALLIRLADAATADVMFWRGALIFLVVGAFALLAALRGHASITRDTVRPLLLIGGIYGINSGLFVFSIGHTSTANTVVILASSPVFAALLSWWFLGERIRRRTVISIIAAIFGVAVIFADSLGAPSWRGDLAAIVLAVSMGAVLTLLRHHAALPRLPLLATSGAVTVLLALPFAQPLSLAPVSYGWLFLMGAVQIPLASWLIMLAPRYIPSAEVSLFLLIETVLGPFWVWLVLNETVPGNTLAGGTIILATIGVNAWLGLRESSARLR